MSRHVAEDGRWAQKAMRRAAASVSVAGAWTMLLSFVALRMLLRTA
jgi:hypothetical protein